MPASLITFRPLGRFFLDGRGELGRRVADRLEAKFVELLAHHRQRQRPDGFVVQIIQNSERPVAEIFY